MLDLTLLAALFACGPCPSPQTEAAASDVAASEVSALERVARVLPPRVARALGVGARVADARGVDLDGASRGWREGAGARGTVLVLTSLTCPLCQKLAPEVARVEARAQGVGFGFVHVSLGGVDSADDLREHRARLGLTGLVLRDEAGALAAALDARTTTEVFVVDARGTLRYRGAVNDQYGLSHALAAPRARFLDDALRALIRGDAPPVLATSSPGCVVERDATARVVAPADITYAREVSRIVQSACVGCHTSGGIAPFPLETYDDVARRAAMILAVVDEGVMPPWFAAHEGDGPSPFENDRSLLPREQATLAAWVRAGKPEGADDDLPMPRVAPRGEWRIGAPDAIFTLPRPFHVPAEGTVDYQYDAVPTGLTEDRWVTGIEVHPGAPSVVHHVLVYALPADAFENGRLRRWDLLDERRGFLAAWAPGSEPVTYPAGYARELRAGTVLMFEVHYTPNGRAALDQSSVGLRFASGDASWSPTHIVRTAGISNRSIRIPAGAEGHVETSTGVAARAMRIHAFMPHMHLRGASFRYEHVAPDGARSAWLTVPRYDFNWQLRYELVEPLTLNAGARLDVTGVFDNSARNAANPAPGVAVRWGPETKDEMLIGFVDYVLVEEDPSVRADDPLVVVLEPGTQKKLRALAAQNEGLLPRATLPPFAHELFDKLDQNGDRVVDVRELALLGEGQ